MLPGPILRQYPKRVSASFRSRRNNGIGIAAMAQIAVFEDIAFRDPLLGTLKDLPRIRLEDNPLTRPKPPRIHPVAEAFGKFFLVVMGIEFRPQVDICRGSVRSARPAAAPPILNFRNTPPP